ncbi:MAG: alpha/beta hydrolase [Pseudomonadota bacterium]
MSAFLSLPIAGPVIALAFIAPGLFLLLHAGNKTLLRRVSGRMLTGFGVLLMMGALTFLLNQRSALSGFSEAPGTLVDIGGYKIHVLCEGPRDDEPTDLWISGGYSQELHLYHLHAEARKTRRSCLVDRAGTGWSERGPLPRTTKRTVDEFEAALRELGEDGPFVIIGHSLGAVIGANFAAHYPERVVGLVAVDGTPWALVNATGHGPEGWCKSPYPTFLVLGSMFGLGQALPFLNPLNHPDAEALHAPLGEMWEPLKAIESQPRSLITAHEGLKESCFGGYDVVKLPGSLGDLPILSIVQQAHADEAQTLAEAKLWQRIEGKTAIANWRRTSEAAREEYANYSTRGATIVAPKDAGHLMTLTEPAFVLAAVDSLRAQVVSEDRRRPSIDDPRPLDGARSALPE